MKFIESRKISFAISIIIIAIGLVMTMINGLNYGIDFTGGTLMEVNLHQEVEISEIREIIDQYDETASINFLGEEKQVVQIRTTTDFNNETRMEIFEQFKENYDLPENEPERSQQFGPAIGREIRNKALLSIFVAAIGMLIYISYRFEFRFGVAAVVALIHDVLILLSVYAIFRIPVNSPFVAAVLTIVGYSINDTIVVFDRVRENLRFLKKSNYAQIANDSISQTIRRSINTSLTTLVMIVALYVLGGQMVRDFALPLIAGVLSGTYSSIFIASPVWVMLKEKQNKKSYKPNTETN